MTSFMLPYPPTLNGLFSGRNRRFKSPAYKNWLRDASADYDVQQYMNKPAWKQHTGEVSVILMLKAPDKRARDLDNLAKAVLDFLVAKKVIVDDSNRYVRTLHIKWHDEMDNPGCFVIIEDMPPITHCPTRYAEGYYSDTRVKPKRKGRVEI